MRKHWLINQHTIDTKAHAQPLSGRLKMNIRYAACYCLMQYIIDQRDDGCIMRGSLHGIPLWLSINLPLDHTWHQFPYLAILYYVLHARANVLRADLHLGALASAPLHNIL